MGERGERWCALDARWGMSKALVLSAVAFWGACAGDTVSLRGAFWLITE
jgi:hypothetical protein